MWGLEETTNQKGKQPIPSAGNQSQALAGSVELNKKRIFVKNDLPPNEFSIWPMRLFSRRRAGHDSGVDITKTAIFILPSFVL